MGKGKKDKKKAAKTNEATEKKGLKGKCCDKYLKKGEHKRCKRCPCFDMPETKRRARFKELGIEFL